MGRKYESKRIFLEKKRSPKIKPLPKAKEQYLSVDEEFEHAQNVIFVVIAWNARTQDGK